MLLVREDNKFKHIDNLANRRLLMNEDQSRLGESYCNAIIEGSAHGIDVVRENDTPCSAAYSSTHGSSAPAIAVSSNG
jgi:hypothetical protein